MGAIAGDVFRNMGSAFLHRTVSEWETAVVCFSACQTHGAGWNFSLNSFSVFSFSWGKYVLIFKQQRLTLLCRIHGLDVLTYLRSCNYVLFHLGYARGRTRSSVRRSQPPLTIFTYYVNT